MADDAERMVALKRAYADIILNTARESAARILAAEHRALRSQQSLSLAKEESLAMLLRLKAIMDSKIKEAEKVNQSQARKIQELEVQLCEAKHAIHQLNSELKRVSSGVESDKSHETESLEEKDMLGCVTPHKEGCQEYGHTSSPNSDINVATSSQRTVPYSCIAKCTTQEEPVSDFIASDDSAGNPDLASLILRNKEPELRRNGCTQRIHAFEQNILTGKELSVQKHALSLDEKHEAVTCEDTQAERHRTRDATLAVGMMAQVKKPLEPEEVGQLGNIHATGQKVKLSRRRSLRKRGIRRVVRGSCSTFNNSKNHAQLDISSSKVDDQNSKVMSCEKQGENNEDTSTYLDEAAARNQKTSKDGNTKLKKFLHPVVQGIMNSNRVMTRQTKKLCNTNLENHRGGSATSASPNSGQENVKREQGTISINDMEDCAHSNRAVKNGSVDTELDCKQILMSPDCDIIGYCNTSESKEDHKMVGNLLTDFASKAEQPCNSSAFPSEVGNDRIVKYTFKRTRKRGSPDSMKRSDSLEENKSKRKATDKESTLLEPSKTNTITESTRDSRRLAQVARQLISLSEKRWW